MAIEPLPPVLKIITEPEGFRGQHYTGDHCEVTFDTWWHFEEVTGLSAAMQLLDFNR